MRDQRGNDYIVTAYFESINSEHYADVAALFADDGELRAPGTDPRRGKDIAAYFAAALGRYPEHRDEPGRILHSGDSATVEIHFTPAAPPPGSRSSLMRSTFSTSTRTPR